MVMRLIAVARDGKIALDTETIFNYPDVANLCRPMESDLDNKPGPRPGTLDARVVQTCAEACGVQRDLIEDVFLSTDSQLIIFYQHIASGAIRLNTVFEIGGTFKLCLLRQTWRLLQDRNQILRTRLVEYEDQVLQVVVNEAIQWDRVYNLAGYKTRSSSYD